MLNSPQIEAISLKMYKIENRRPNDYRENYLWKQLNQQRDRLSIKLAKEELAYHKERVAKLGKKRAEDSVIKIRQYELFLERYDDKNSTANFRESSKNETKV